MTEELRPRISRQEIALLLELLKEAEANVSQECLNLSEEAERLKITVSALESNLRLGDYSVVRELRMSQDRLQHLRFQAVPACRRKQVIFKGLELKFGRILAHKKGRMPLSALAAVKWLKVMEPKNLEISHSSHTY
jgi:hypothetical protein